MQRDVLIIGAICVIAIVIGAWLYLFEVKEVSSQPAAVSFTVLEHGTNALLTDRKNYRIKTSEEFREVWTYAFGPDSTPPSSVDFNTHHVLAVFEGQHASGGYDIAVSAVVDTDSAREVMVTHLEPGAECVTTQAMTSPYEFVLVPKSQAQIVRTDLTVTKDCN